MAETERAAGGGADPGAEPRADASEVRLSTGMAVRVREPHDQVVTRFAAAGAAGPRAVLTLTRGDGTPVHVVAGHVVLIEPVAARPAPGTAPGA
jgi:hypothetical protein